MSVLHLMGITGVLGLGLIFIMLAVALLGIRPLNIWVTPVAWYGYILFIDSLVYRRKGSSLLRSRFGEFLFMLPLSVAFWLVFEWHNLSIQNWEYVGIPENPWVAGFAFAISFATILPALWETNELLKTWPFFRIRIRPQTFAKKRLISEMVFGFLCIAVPVIYPSQATGPLIWIGYLFVFAPLNALLGIPSVLKEREKGEMTSTVTLCLTGLVCGFIWEFLNYWAGAKWIYHVPYGTSIRIFEMPIVGFLGFMPFTIAFIEMYHFTRYVLGQRKG